MIQRQSYFSLWDQKDRKIIARNTAQREEEEEEEREMGGNERGLSLCIVNTVDLEFFF